MFKVSFGDELDIKGIVEMNVLGKIKKDRKQEGVKGNGEEIILEG